MAQGSENTCSESMRINCGKREWENWRKTALRARKCQVQRLVMRVPTLAKLSKSVSVFITSSPIAYVPFPGICLTPYSPGGSETQSSGRIVGKPEGIRVPRCGLALRSRLMESYDSSLP